MSTGSREQLAARCAFLARGFLSTDPEAVRQAATLLAAQERQAAENALAGDAAELEKEYVRLFLSPSGAPCPPWQSAYSEEGTLMGEPHASALEWYRSKGVEPVRESEPADHAGMLLAFYAHLLESQAPPEELAAFRQQHLMWLRQLSELVGEHARHPFYRLVAEMTRRVVDDSLPGSG
ncbi:MAG: molecular chaperone TorD family protein [Bryobacterales bacterium]|nr:molecular chaperone TorD family protein [Bryobacteraceae bacterium]MDW8355662.1 molecular chaperone TorD family protein [Bryobacterales bacterium]